jgi:hypothetical protein
MSGFCSVWVCLCFCNVWVCVCVGFCIVWVCVCLGFCNVWVCVCLGFVLCVSFGKMCTCICCVLYCLYCVFFHCFVYLNVFLLNLSVLPPSNNSIAVSNYCYYYYYYYYKGIILKLEYYKKRYAQTINHFKDSILMFDHHGYD